MVLWWSSQWCYCSSFVTDSDITSWVDINYNKDKSQNTFQQFQIELAWMCPAIECCVCMNNWIINQVSFECKVYNFTNVFCHQIAGFMTDIETELGVSQQRSLVTALCLVKSFVDILVENLMYFGQVLLSLQCSIDTVNHSKSAISEKRSQAIVLVTNIIIVHCVS